VAYNNGVGRMGKVHGAPGVGAPDFQAKNNNNFPFFSVTVKIRIPGYQALECFIATLPTEV